MCRVLFITCLLIMLAFHLAYGQAPETYSDDPRMPEGLLGDRIRSVITILNSPTPEAVERFMSQECTEEFRNFASMETHIATFQSMNRHTGGVDFHGIRTYTPNRPRETAVIIQDRNYGAWRTFRLFIDDRETYLLSGLLFDSDPGTPTDVKEPALSEAEVIEQVRQIVDRVCANDAFSGTVLLARNDEVLYEHACGEASKRFSVPVDIDTRFNLCSITKLFTAIAIVQLAEAGVLSYDDLLSDHIDESWLPREISSQITLHHLLTHTSGLGHYFTESSRQTSPELYRRLEDFKPLVCADTLAFEPGTSFRYSNTGMFLLGVVVANTTGQDYFDYVQQNIFQTAGMDHTGFFHRDEPVRNVAIGYYRDLGSETGWREETFMLPVGSTPSTQAYSTVGDLHRFALALLDSSLVSDTSLGGMWGQPRGGRSCGVRVHDGPLGLAVGHTGGSWGASSHLTIYPDSGYIIVALSNYRTSASTLVERIEQLLERTR